VPALAWCPAGAAPRADAARLDCVADIADEVAASRAAADGRSKATIEPPAPDANWKPGPDLGGAPAERPRRIRPGTCGRRGGGGGAGESARGGAREKKGVSRGLLKAGIFREALAFSIGKL
jgi:hypothetical protein